MNAALKKCAPLVSCLLFACHGGPNLGSSTSNPAVLIASGKNYVAALSGTKQANGQVEHVIAEYDLDAAELNVALEVLSLSGGAPVTLEDKPTVWTGPVPVPSRDMPTNVLRPAVFVAPAPPEAVLYFDSVDDHTGMGTLKFVDLSQPQPASVALSSAAQVFPGDACFGANGHQIVFETYSSASQMMDAMWSDGTTTKLLVHDVYGLPWLTQDRSKGLFSLQVDPQAGVGDLVRADLSNGSSTFIASQVKLNSSAYAAMDPHLLDPGMSTYAASPDGMTVAYADTSDALHLNTGNTDAVIAPFGMFPSVSPDGQTAAFYTKDSFVVWSRGKVVFQVPVTKGLLPRFSPDGRFVAFLTSCVVQDTSFEYGNVVGDFSVLDLQSLQSVPWAKGVLWYSLRFGPETGPTTELRVLGKLRGDGPTYDREGETVDLLVGAPTSAPAVPAAMGLWSDAVIELPHGAGYAYEAYPDLNHQDPSANLWTPGASQPSLLAPSIDEGSLSGASEAATGGAAGEVVFRSPWASEFSFAAPGLAPQPFLESSVFSAVLDDGRLLGITGKEIDTTEIWVRKSPL